MPQTINNMVQEWANSSTTFTALKMNVQGPGGGAEQSAAASLLMDLQVGGSSKVNFRKDGSLSLNVGGGNPILIRSVDAYGTAEIAGVSGGIRFKPSGSANSAAISWDGNFLARSAGAFSFLPGGDYSAAIGDTILTRRAAANLRLGAADAAGSASAVTIDFATNANNITWTSHGLMTGSAVMFSAVSFPTSSSGNLNGTTTYYAVVVNANTIQIARTYDAAVSATPTVIAFTGNGTTVTARGAKTEQTLSVQNFTGTDMPGSPLVFDSAQGTGAGVGGPILFRIAPAGSSGSLQNALETLLTINPNRTVDIGGLTINPANGGTTFQQTFAITMQTSNAFVIRHGNSDGLDVRPVSSGSPNILLKNASNAIQAALWGEANNTLALRNGGTSGTPVPQTFRVYNWTDGTNSEFASLSWFASDCYLLTSSAGTGAARNLILRASGDLILGSGNNTSWRISGSLLAQSDNAHDIGASGANRPRNIYAAGSATISGDVTVGGGSGLALTNGPAVLVGANARMELIEVTAPAAPAANRVRIYAEDDGAGKTRLMARFATGAAVQIAIEP